MQKWIKPSVVGRIVPDIRMAFDYLRRFANRLRQATKGATATASTPTCASTARTIAVEPKVMPTQERILYKKMNAPITVAVTNKST